MNGSPPTISFFFFARVIVIGWADFFWMTPEEKNEENYTKLYFVSYPRKDLHGTIWMVSGLKPTTTKR